MVNFGVASAKNHGPISSNNANANVLYTAAYDAGTKNCVKAGVQGAEAASVSGPSTEEEVHWLSLIGNLIYDLAFGS